MTGRGCSTKDKVYYKECETNSYGEVNIPPLQLWIGKCLHLRKRNHHHKPTTTKTHYHKPRKTKTQDYFYYTNLHNFDQLSPNKTNQA